ncbi:MAG: N-6 DNA methylase [Nitrospirae bacterium]|nr:N-6 DNA methylase [Nitrospirota bacterium]
MAFTSAIDRTIEHKLFDALVLYFKHENFKLGHGVTDAQIDTICKVLLYSQAEESTLNEYRKEELEIVDYLHLISIELRKQLGQYATPAAIVRRILRSVGFASSKDILSKRLIDPACGSGAFLVEAVRVYLSALKKTKTPMPEGKALWFSA